MKITRSVNKQGTIEYINENGEWHREDGPAIIRTNGYEAWYINGKSHREDGPARIWSDGDGWYFLNGIEYTKEDWELEVAKLKLERIKDL